MATSASSRKVRNVTDPSKPVPNEKNTPADTAKATPAPEENSTSSGVDKATEAADVKALLSRHTFDGKGENAVPPANFRGFSTEGVEKEALKDSATVAQEVLNGNWGANPGVAVQRLHDAGYGDQLDEIEREFNDRKRRGAPSAF